MRHAFAQQHGAEVTHVDAALGQRLVEFHQHRLVFRPDGPDDSLLAVFQGPPGCILTRIRAHSQPRKRLGRHVGAVDYHARIECDQRRAAIRPRLHRQQGIDVKLLDPGLLHNQLTEIDQDLLQRGHVHCLAPAYPFQCPADHCLFHHASRQRGVEGRQSQRTVFEDLHQRPTGAEEQHRSKLRVHARTDDQFIRAFQLDHRLHGNALEMLGPYPLTHRPFDRPIRVTHIVCVLQVEAHTADVGLVCDCFRIDLQHDGVAELVGPGHGVRLTGRNFRRHDGDIVQRQQLLGFGLSHDRTAGCAHGIHQLRCVGAILAAGLHIGAQHRRFVEAAQVVAVTPHVVEHARGGVRVVEGGDCALIEDRLSLFYVRPAHPTGQHRLTRRLGKRHERLGRARGIRHGLGREDDEQPIAVGVAGRNFERLRVSLRAGVAQHIHRIVVTPRGWQDLVQFLVRGLGQFGQLTAAHEQGIGCQHARPAGVGDDRQASPRGSRLLGKHLGHIKKIGNAVHAQDAAAPESRFEHFVAASQRTGMRSGGLGCPFGAPGLDDNNRLGQRDFTGGREKRPCIADRFHVDDNALGAWIIAQVMDQIAPADIQHRTDGDKGSETHILLEAPVKNGRAQRAALTDEANLAGARNGVGKGGVHAAQAVHHTQAVGADDAHLVARLRHDLRLQRDTLRTGLLEAGRDDDRAAHARFDALADDVGHRGRRRHDHRQVNRVRHLTDAWIRFDAQHVGPFGVDGEDGAPEGTADQIPKNGAPHTASFFGGADQRDRLRVEDGMERLLIVTEVIVCRINARRS